MKAVEAKTVGQAVGRRHAWVWQLAFAFSSRTQVCCRQGCGWYRKRVEIRGNRRGVKARVSRWAYAPGPGLGYRLLLTVPRCWGAKAVPVTQRRGRKALTTPHSGLLR